jgi:hypothetical protein
LQFSCQFFCHHGTRHQGTPRYQFFIIKALDVPGVFYWRALVAILAHKNSPIKQYNSLKKGFFLPGKTMRIFFPKLFNF